MFQLPRHEDFEEITVLGRGQSAQAFFNSDRAYHSPIWLVNYTSKDLQRSWLEKLSRCEVWIMANRTEPTLSRRDIRRLHVARVFWAGLSTDPTRMRAKRKLERYGRPTETLDGLMSLEEFYAGGGSGGICVRAASRLARHVRIYGLDFYTGDYVNTELKRLPRKEFEQLRDNEIARGEYLAQCVNGIVRSSPDVNFSVTTRVPDYWISAPNVHVERDGS